MVFKTMEGSDVILVDYIRNFLKNNNDVDILIGCDSQNCRDKTVYAVVVALHRRGKGADVIYRKWRTPKERVAPIRLLNEVWASVETAEFIKNAGLPMAKWIDLDLNPDPKFKSNEVLRQAVGLVEGMGYHARYKTMGPVCTYTADHLVKH